MENGNAPFFYQFLLPICYPEKSGIRDDPWKTFYSVAGKYTNKYAIHDKECDTSYGNPFRPTNVVELVNFDDIVFQNGNDNIHDDWCNDYSGVID